MNDDEALDDAKRRFLSARADIDRLRQKIAEAACPLSIGDQVVVLEGDKTYSGIIAVIGAAPEIEDLFEPRIGASTPWVASGKRIRKADGGESRWSFAIPGDAELVDGVWHLPDRSIGRFFGVE